MIRRFVVVAGLLLVGTACPQMERKVYTFDLAAGTGELLLVNVRTDAPSTGVNDFLDVVERAVQGTYFEEQHPRWRVTSKELVANGQNLDGVVKFAFDSPADAGLYKHDSKSPYIWCSTDPVLSTNGKRIDDVLPGCVAWDRKATKLEVVVKSADYSGSEASLLPYFERWKAGETLTRITVEGGGPPDIVPQPVDVPPAPTPQ